MQEYRNICDCCSKETKGFVSPGWGDAGHDIIARNNWDVRIYSTWLEGSENPDAKELATAHEVNLDACLDCAGKIGAAIRAEMDRIKIAP